MCGIVACTGLPEAGRHLLEALGRLEYRGYDSAGIAVPVAARGRTATLRTTARVGDLAARFGSWNPGREASSGLGHTRWATHGEVSEHNAHPHTDCSGRIAVVHNGVLEDVPVLRTALVAAGHAIASQTDSELIAHLIEQHRDSPSLTGAVAAAVRQLRGSWALAVLDAATAELVVTCHGSPLVVGESGGGVFAASDIGAIAAWVREYRIVEDHDVVALHDGVRWHRGATPATPPPAVTSTIGAADVTRGLYPDFMAKEIEQQPEVAAQLLATWRPAVRSQLWPSFDLPLPEHVTVVGCGTSLHAGRAVAQVAAHVGGVPFAAIEASEVESAVTAQHSLALVLSQSGETADVLRALDVLQERGHPVLALTNNPHSALARRASAFLVCHAGPEIGVAATKTFTAQVLGGSLAMLSMLASAGRVSEADLVRLGTDLERIPDLLAYAIGSSRGRVPAVVERVRHAGGFVFLGRGRARVFADEGALKLKELTYRWAESHAAGELKHGPLALIERGTPVVVIDDGSARLAASIAEVRARGAEVITVGPDDATIPTRTGRGPTQLASGLDWLGPLEAVVGLQVLARELAVALGRDVDKPRNLAKSVTVE